MTIVEVYCVFSNVYFLPHVDKFNLLHCDLVNVKYAGLNSFLWYVKMLIKYPLIKTQIAALCWCFWLKRSFVLSLATKPFSWNSIKFKDLGMIYSKQLIWSGLDRTVLNSEWFLNRSKSSQFAQTQWKSHQFGNAALPLTLAVTVFYSSDSQTSNLKPRNIFCAHLLRSVLFQSIKFISCASLYFGQVFILCKFIFYANFLRGTHFQSISASTVFWQKCFLGKSGHHRKYFLNFLQYLANWIFIQICFFVFLFGYILRL